jgi:hypothetical protein
VFTQGILDAEELEEEIRRALEDKSKKLGSEGSEQISWITKPLTLFRHAHPFENI